MFKRLAIIAILCVPFVSAKSYTFIVADKTQVGTVQLKPGEYSMTLKGAQAVFTDENGHRVQAAAKVEAGDSTFSDTSVVQTTSNGVERIEYIGLKGTKDKVVFNQ
jgi:hypothetical protein